MNDRCVGLLSNYEVEVLRTAKGRGAILCETNHGPLIFKEYIGRKNKVLLQNEILSILHREQIKAEEIIPNKEGELLVTDYDGTSYLLKTYHPGRECDMKNIEDCKKALEYLASLHQVPFEMDCLTVEPNGTSLYGEYEKHTRELKKIRKFLLTRSQKSDFELALLQNYDYFYEQAVEVCSKMNEMTATPLPKKICHGDYQYHNILFDGEPFAINFEKCILENVTRDLGLFLRKLLEKNAWNEQMGILLVDTYQQHRTMMEEEKTQLYLRLAYPEKFWKIANFYYNSGKAWIPGKNMEKLFKLMQLEEEKKKFLERYQEVYLA